MLAALGVALANFAFFIPSPGDCGFFGVPTILTTVAWLFIAYMAFMGRNWARLTFVVIAILAVPGGTLSVLALTGVGSLAAILTGVQTCLNLLAAILLLLPSSSRWYRALKNRPDHQKHRTDSGQ